MISESRPPRQGDVWWAWLDPTAGLEQGDRRPVVVIASTAYLEVVDTLAIVVPVSSTERGWPNHVEIQGVPHVSGWAMTEQLRTLSMERLDALAGTVTPHTLATIQVWLRDFLDLTP
ncbi:type II toxin-antitoxin system PemK/MazF family toxin [Demetria terragena]|uniref:type II toxin-antitoxin system PemK/MazF family toxin n=1 Tax=Demetria terragena TaxID=63959 RepID=UPI00036C53DD|nr:type II toxin-antitoxin system PemK/MazF family toxin [Demetria terragena]